MRIIYSSHIKTETVMKIWALIQYKDVILPV